MIPAEHIDKGRRILAQVYTRLGCMTDADRALKGFFDKKPATQALFEAFTLFDEAAESLKQLNTELLRRAMNAEQKLAMLEGGKPRGDLYWLASDPENLVTDPVACILGKDPEGGVAQFEHALDLPKLWVAALPETEAAEEWGSVSIHKIQVEEAFFAELLRRQKLEARQEAA